METVRVVFLWDNLWEVGGVTTFLSTCLQQLPQYGIDPRVVELGHARPPLERRRDGLIDGRPRPWQTLLTYRRSVVRKIVAHRPHVLVSNSQWGWEYLATFHRRIPFVDIMHADFPNAEGWQYVGSHAHKLEALVGVSDRVARRLSDLPGAAGKVVNIPYGVAGDYTLRDAPGPEGPVIVFAGRMVQSQKRPRDLVPFAEAISRQLDASTLLIIGDGPEKAYLDQALAAYAPRVTLIGALPQEEVLQYYKRAHFFVQFSQFEGLSIALLEAMAHGVVPVVTAIDSGVGQVIDEGRNGFLFPVGQPEKAARLIAANLGRWQPLSASAHRTWAEGFTTDVMVRRYAELFRSLAGAPLEQAPAFRDEGYDRLSGRVARRLLPIWIYRDIMRRVI